MCHRKRNDYKIDMAIDTFWHESIFHKIGKVLINPYDSKKLLLIAVVFMAIGFAMLATYAHPIIRYSIVDIIVVLGIIFRKRIVSTLKGILNLRKKNA